MKSRLKIGAMITGLTLGMTAFGLAGCEPLVAKYKSDLAAIEQQNSGMAVQPDTSQSQPTQLVMPTDKKMVVAINEALPTIKKVLAIHQCLKSDDGLRQMNFYAVTGVNVADGHTPGAYWSALPITSIAMKYHDKNKCVSVQAIDQWTMPANNALQFRAVFFGEDSGEVVNFLYLFKKVDDGSWKIAQFNQATHN
jgi:hypothetical protein